MFALQLIYISVLFRPRAYEYAAFSAVSRVAIAGSSGAVSEASAHKIPISESLKVLGNFQQPTRRLCPDVRGTFHTVLRGVAVIY